MSIRFIYGRAGTGKSKFCIDQIRKSVENNDKNDLILIVPEQYTFNIENKILKLVGESALLRTRVLSFKRMAHMVFDECGGRAKQIIKKSGKEMLIHKVLNENIDSLDYFKRISREQGFNEIISEIITEFKKYNINPESLVEVNEKISDMELAEKIRELAVLYNAFEDKMSIGYIDSDDELTLLSKKLLENDIFNGAEIWIDEFTTFTPQQLDIISILGKRAKRLNITLCKEDIDITNEDDVTDIFNTINNTENRLLKLMEENHIAYDKPIDLNRHTGKNRFSNNEELKHIEKYFFTYPFKEYAGRNQRLSLYKANNIYDEIDRVSKSIITMVREKGYRY